MKILDIKSVRLPGEDGAALVIRHDNRGEPYRAGVTLGLEYPDYRYSPHMFLEASEAIQLRDLLNNLFPSKAKLA